MRQLALTHAAILTPFNLIEEATILVEGKKIKAVGSVTDIQIPPGYQEIGLEGLLIAPGFIDQHLHGGGGSEIMQGTTECLTDIAKFHATHGTTAFLATTISGARDQLVEVAKAYAGLPDEYLGARCLGLHLEGPYLSPVRSGIHSAYTFREPSVEEVLTIHRLSGSGVKMVTMAPELKGAMNVARELINEGIVCSIGHSNADYDETLAAIDAGFSAVTHCYNQLKPFHHRDPGVIGAALTNDALSLELIVDNIHLHQAAVDLAYRAKGEAGIILVSDAMAPVGLLDGSYQTTIGELKVENGKLTDGMGKLAGSTLTLDKAVKNFFEITRCELTEVFRMVTYNPAKFLGINKKKGSLYPGKDADIIVLTPDLEVVMTMVEGEIISGLITPY